MEHSSSMIGLINSHFEPNQTTKEKKPLQTDVWQGLKFDDFLSDKVKTIRNRTRDFMETHNQELIPYLNKTEFPFHLVEKIKALQIGGLQSKDFGGIGFSAVETGALVYEMAKRDASIATFVCVHECLGVHVIDSLGNDEQRQRMLPDCIKLNKVCCFGLTEKDFGSDATSLQSTAKKVEGGYILNGNKRWIGNATFADYLIIWAKNEAEGNKIQAFVVEKGTKGLSTSKIENKYSLRMVQNANIFLDNVFVPEKNRLEKGKDFATGANIILEHSRLAVAWEAAAIAAGAYEACLKYTLQRKQFGKQIASFQITQEKLSRMCAMVEMMLSLCMRVSQLFDQGKTSIGQISRTKSICTRLGREVCQIARETCGGNGILLENQVIKAMLDMESIHTYEGTYDINMLVSGREITGGISAFKK